MALTILASIFRSSAKLSGTLRPAVSTRIRLRSHGWRVGQAFEWAGGRALIPKNAFWGGLPFRVWFTKGWGPSLFLLLISFSTYPKRQVAHTSLLGHPLHGQFLAFFGGWPRPNSEKRFLGGGLPFRVWFTKGWGPSLFLLLISFSTYREGHSLPAARSFKARRRPSSSAAVRHPRR